MEHDIANSSYSQNDTECRSSEEMYSEKDQELNKSGDIHHGKESPQNIFSSLPSNNTQENNTLNVASQIETQTPSPLILGTEELKLSQISRLFNTQDLITFSQNCSENVEKETTPVHDLNGTLKNIEFKKKQQLLVSPPSDPFEAWRLLVDDNILDLIVKETNINAARAHIMINDRISNWKELTREELSTFLGLLLHMGTIRLDKFNSYWKTHWLHGIPCFGQYMPRLRFIDIYRHLNFSSDTADGSRLDKIRPIINLFNYRMNEIYYPGKNLFLGKSVALGDGRLLFRTEIERNLPKHNETLHILAEPEGVVLKFEIDAGTADESQENHTNNIVLDLLEEKLDSGHSVYMDSSYNSYDLAIQLLNRDTYCTGTLRINRKDSLTDLYVKFNEKSSFIVKRVNIGVWEDERFTFYLSTEHDSNLIKAAKCDNRPRKPSALVHYNKIVYSMDRQEQMLSHYPCERKSFRWYKKLFVHILQTCLSNAYFLYNMYSPNKKNDFNNFRFFILEKLLPKPTGRDLQQTPKEHKLTKIQKVKQREKKEGTNVRTIQEVVRRECKGCKAKKKRKSTNYECKDCPGGPTCFCTECFFEYHVCFLKN